MNLIWGLEVSDADEGEDLTVGEAFSLFWSLMPRLRSGGLVSCW